MSNEELIHIPLPLVDKRRNPELDPYLRQLSGDKDFYAYGWAASHVEDHSLRDISFLSHEALKAACQNPPSLYSGNDIRLGLWVPQQEDSEEHSLEGLLSVRPEDDDLYVDFWLETKSRGIGYGSLALTGLTNYMLYMLKSTKPDILAQVSIDNQKARATLGRSGYIELHQHEDEIIFGLPLQMEEYEIKDSELVIESKELLKTACEMFIEGTLYDDIDLEETYAEKFTITNTSGESTIVAVDYCQENSTVSIYIREAIDLIDKNRPKYKSRYATYCVLNARSGEIITYETDMDIRNNKDVPMPIPEATRDIENKVQRFTSREDSERLHERVGSYMKRDDLNYILAMLQRARVERI